MNKNKDPLRFLKHYPEAVLRQIEAIAEQGKLANYLLSKYPARHELQNEKQLYQFALSMKSRSMRKSPPLNKVSYNDKIDVVNNALGLHKQISRSHGGKLKAKREIVIASVFKTGPEDFLRMITAHELAHFKEAEHNKAFYKLCQHIAPDYHQLELDTRIFLMLLELEDNPYT